MKRATSRPEAGLEEYILIYSRQERSSGGWKKQYYNDSFIASGLQAAFRETRTRWTELDKRYRHRLLAFESLSVRVGWDPALPFGRVPDPRVELSDRRFLLRYQVKRNGVGGMVKEARRKEIRASSLREAYNLATSAWTDISRIETGPRAAIGLYELLPWKP